MQKWGKRYPDAGYGGMFYRWLREKSPEPYGSFGNGSAMRVSELLQATKVSSMEDIQELFRETIAQFMENGLQSELDDELGYGRYDQSEKSTDNSRNGYSSKTLKTSFGDAEIAVPRDRKGEFDPQILKMNQTSISEDIEAKIISMYAKGMITIFFIKWFFVYKRIKHCFQFFRVTPSLDIFSEQLIKIFISLKRVTSFYYSFFQANAIG